jgi:AraC-like DNA-binding protein
LRGVRYAELAPSPRLRPWVRCYWSFDSESPAPGPAEAISPDGSPELIFHLGAAFQRLDDAGRVTTQHRTVFVGQIERAMRVRPAGRAWIFAVRFRPAGAAAFVRGAARGLASLSTPLADVWGRPGDELAERVAATRDDAGRAALVEEALLRRLAPARSSELAASAADRIAAAQGCVRIDRLADGLGVGVRTLERAFDECVGISPKTLARIARFRHALGALAGPRRPEFAAVAHDCGYADQSHLVRDFREFAGEAPTRYLAVDRPMADHFTV